VGAVTANEVVPVKQFQFSDRFSKWYALSQIRDCVQQVCVFHPVDWDLAAVFGAPDGGVTMA
jgi:hypothetical protein